MIATSANPCECGNTDYQAFWCDNCKRPEDEFRISIKFKINYDAYILDDAWIKLEKNN